MRHAHNDIVKSATATVYSEAVCGLLGDEVTDAVNTPVLCCLYSHLQEMLAFS